MHVLALVPGGVDEQLLFFPTLETLKRTYPDAQIDVMAAPRARDAYRVCKFSHDNSLKTYPFDFEDRNGMADWGNWLGIVRDGEYDAVLTCDNSWYVGFLLWMSGIPTRIGYSGGGAQMFLTNRISLKPEQYAPEVYDDLLQGLEIDAPCPPVEVTLLKEDLDWAIAEQKRLGIDESGYVLIYVGSAPTPLQNQKEAYPLKNWQAIVQTLQEKQPDVPIALLETSDNSELVRAFVSSVPSLKVFAPEDMGKMAAAIAGADLLLCPDSAAMQLAVGVQTYTIALFGATDPAKRLPTGDKFTSIKSPTGNLADITPEMVLKPIFG
ncbi:MAG: glycosyltransferase family 9 protein [Cyanobacteriota bacterium]|nr:glycosyltransferase family 9 protein [Cyanobacteriota bacterium]